MKKSNDGANGVGGRHAKNAPHGRESAGCEPLGPKHEPLGSSGGVLLVDDEPLFRASMTRLLTGVGYSVAPFASAEEAEAHAESRVFDLVLADVNLPGMSGLELLRRVRERDALVSVVLISGDPSAQAAAEAASLGAMHYLIKPVDSAKMLEIVERVVRLTRFARLQRLSGQLYNGALSAEDPARLGRNAQLTHALETLWLAHQPIVRAEDHEVIGYEVLMRFDDPSLKGPPGLLDLAERCGRLEEVGRAVRQRAALSPTLHQRPDSLLFVNLHARDLEDQSLRSPSGYLSSVASRVVLEITERASLEHVSNVSGFVTDLRALGFRLAVDDLGAGYSGLSSLTLLEPEFVKLDMSLVRDIDTNAAKRRIVAALIGVARELGITVVSEGVETSAERDVLADLGSHLLQGYLLGKPARIKPTPAMYP